MSSEIRLCGLCRYSTARWLRKASISALAMIAGSGYQAHEWAKYGMSSIGDSTVIELGARCLVHHLRYVPVDWA